MNFNKLNSHKSIPEVAANMVDKIFDGLLSRNGDGFSKPRTSKRAYARGIKVTPVEWLLYIADPEGNPLPTRERSKRGKQKALQVSQANARMKDYHERLMTYRKEPGVHHLAKKLPYPTWPAILKPPLRSTADRSF